MAGPSFRVQSSRGGSSPGIGAKLFFSVFCLFFLGMGSLLTVQVGKGIAATARSYGWPQTECTVLASGVEERPGAANADEAYRFTVTYLYDVAGQTRAGSTYRLGYLGSSDVTSARRLAATYAPGARVPCWVDPDTPTSAVLRRRSLLTALWILLPLLFVAAGGGGLAFTWGAGRLFGIPAQSNAANPAKLAPISERAGSPRWVPGCLVAFLGIFLLAGLGTAVFFVRPALQVLAARSWQPTPCTILYCAVRTHAGDKSETYSMDVLYSYLVDDREHRSSRFEFMGGSSSGYERYEEAARSHPAGSRATCYVDPGDPEEAVLERGFDRQYLAGIVPLLFILAGGGGIALVLRGMARSRAKAAAGTLDWLPDGAAAPSVVGRATVGAGPLTLAPEHTPLGGFFAILFACLFWNGIVSVFVHQDVLSWRQGDRQGGLTLFLVPFVLVGLLLIGGVVYQLLALANPRPVLTLSRAALPLGATARLDWRFRPLAGRIRRLRIALEGREEASWGSGKTTSTGRETFATIPIVETDETPAILAGSASFSVPADTMHSFAAAHNKVVWTLKVRGEIRGWPDVDADFDVAVLPPEALA